jgi:hypothetical protein
MSISAVRAVTFGTASPRHERGVPSQSAYHFLPSAKALTLFAICITLPIAPLTIYPFFRAFTGIINFGNICYLNAVLQYLFHVKRLIE